MQQIFIANEDTPLMAFDLFLSINVFVAELSLHVSPSLLVCSVMVNSRSLGYVISGYLCLLT
jgi:hypothetical protein